jgi:hypothetical protein
MANITRQTFLRAGAAVAAAPLLGNSARAQIMRSERLREFDYDEVTIEGRMRAQFDTNHAFFMAVSEDSLLKPYRLRTGLPAPGDDLGGWYSDHPAYDPHGSSNGFVPGGTFGQYVSGLARAYAITKAPATKAKVERLVRGVAPTLSEKFYRGYHTPTYTFDKIERGLLDAWRYAGVREALPLIDKRCRGPNSFCARTPTKPTAGTKAIRCRKTSSSPTRRRARSAIKSWASAFCRTIRFSIRWPAASTRWSANTPTAT